MKEPTTGRLNEALRHWILDCVGGGELVAAEPLAGATSSTLCRVLLIDGDEQRRLVLRLFTNREWLAEEPDLVRHEAAALQAAENIPVAAPRLVAVDGEGSACGVPAVLMTEVPGRVDLLPQSRPRWLEGLAETLHAIHGTPVPGDFSWRYRPWYDAARLTRPEWSAHRDRWTDAAARLTEGRPSAAARFIHRDFHPVNLLWTDQEVSGVVDWVNACIGPAEADVAHCRLNLALLMGMEEADAFLRAYSVRDYDPWWDLNAFAEFFQDVPRVYPGWPAFGVRGLTDRLIRERADRFLAAAMDRSG